MSAPSAIITLTTDFGTADVFVGVMKGVVARIAPCARVVDLTHSVAPFDAEEAAALLRDAFPWFPEGTVHVVVVDPGVGTQRGIIAAEAGGHFFLAPDTGILWPVLRERPEARVVRVGERRFFLPTVSGTFHGRDIFAPVAAHLALGTPLESLGPPAQAQPGNMPEPEPLPGGGVRGAIVRFDRFGNAITNIPADRARGATVLRVKGQTLRGVHPTFGAAEPGEALAVAGSFGKVEICINRGDARKALGLGRGDEVVLLPEMMKDEG